MRNDWRLYTTHEGISSVRNSELDEKNFYRMKVFMKNYFKEYKENVNNSNMRVKYDAKGKVESFYSIDKIQQYIDMLNLNSFKLYIEEDSNNYNFNTEESTKNY